MFIKVGYRQGVSIIQTWFYAANFNAGSNINHFLWINVSKDVVCVWILRCIQLDPIVWIKIQLDWMTFSLGAVDAQVVNRCACIMNNSWVYCCDTFILLISDLITNA